MTETPQPPHKPAAAAPAAPVGRSLDEIRRDPLIAGAAERAGDAITAAKEFAGEITLTVDRNRIVDVCRAFKDDGFNYLVDLTGSDYSKYPNHSGPRFAVAYTLYSFRKNNRVRLKVWTDEAVPSVSGVWKTANWHERATWDMYGIRFDGHPNLERILMWEGFNGFPLRKDFPIRGIDTGARIYPEVFPEGGGPKAGSTGKDVKDVNIYQGEWNRYGTWPPAQIAGGEKQAPNPELAGVVAETAKPTEEAPSHGRAVEHEDRVGAQHREPSSPRIRATTPAGGQPCLTSMRWRSTSARSILPLTGFSAFCSPSTASGSSMRSR